MTAISKRIDTAIKHLSEKDFENALIQISIAIDKTAKKKYGIKEVGKRMKRFVKEYENFIYQFATGGHLFIGTGAKIIINGEELHDTVYKSIRCALQHGDELEDKIQIDNEIGLLGSQNGKVIINSGHIDGLLFAVIADEVNKHESCDSNPIYSRHPREIIVINELWGNIEKVEEITGYMKLVT